MKQANFLAVIGVMMSFSPISNAATKFVSDTLYIPLKTENNAGKVIKHLKSGTKLSVLETDDKTDFVRVKVHDEDSSEGWVKARYLLDKPIAKSRLARLESKVKSLETQQEPLKKSIRELKAKLKIAKSQNQALKLNEKSLQNSLSKVKNISSESIALFEANKKLEKSTKELTESVKELRKENLLLQANQKNEGIKLGLFAIGLGGLAGFLLPYLKPRARRQRAVRLR